MWSGITKLRKIFKKLVFELFKAKLFERGIYNILVINMSSIAGELNVFDCFCFCQLMHIQFASTLVRRWRKSFEVESNKVLKVKDKETSQLFFSKVDSFNL